MWSVRINGSFCSSVERDALQAPAAKGLSDAPNVRQCRSVLSSIGTFVAHTFGPLHGGRTNGVLWLLASILNFALFPMTKFILERADGDWQLLNLLLLLACVPAYLFVQLVLKPSVAAIAGAEKPARE